MGKAEEREALRFTQATPGPAFGRKAAKLDQASLLWVQQQRELLEPLLQLRQKSPGIRFVLKAGNEIVGVAHEDDLPAGVAASPPLGPQIKGVVQVDVGEQR